MCFPMIGTAERCTKFLPSPLPSPALAAFHQSQDHGPRCRLVEAAADLFGAEMYRTRTLDA